MLFSHYFDLNLLSLKLKFQSWIGSMLYSFCKKKICFRGGLPVFHQLPNVSAFFKTIQLDMFQGLQALNTHLQFLTLWTHVGSLQNLLYQFLKNSILKPPKRLILLSASSRSMSFHKPKPENSLKEARNCFCPILRKPFRLISNSFIPKGFQALSLQESCLQTHMSSIII